MPLKSSNYYSVHYVTIFGVVCLIEKIILFYGEDNSIISALRV